MFKHRYSHRVYFSILIYFRYWHAIVRSFAESISFLRGEKREHQTMTSLFQKLISVQRKIINIKLLLDFFTNFFDYTGGKALAGVFYQKWFCALHTLILYMLWNFFLFFLTPRILYAMEFSLLDHESLGEYVSVHALSFQMLYFIGSSFNRADCRLRKCKYEYISLFITLSFPGIRWVFLTI